MIDCMRTHNPACIYDNLVVDVFLRLVYRIDYDTALTAEFLPAQGFLNKYVQ